MVGIDLLICLGIREMNISRIRIFNNTNKKSNEILNEVVEKLKKESFEVVDDDNYDLAIAIGGDGAFLRMIKGANFKSDCYYIGINAGTLGFAQEVSTSDIDKFIELIKTHNYKVEPIGVAEVSVKTKDATIKHLAINEAVIRNFKLNTAELEVYVDDSLLENFVGDGLLISTSFGSTAYNLSFGGSIVFNTFHTLQITPIAPLNSKAYRSLLNSVIIPDNMGVRIVPKRDNGDIILTVDGDNKFYNGVLEVSIVMKRKVNIIRLEGYDFIQRINDKFLR